LVKDQLGEAKTAKIKKKRENKTSVEKMQLGGTKTMGKKSTSNDMHTKKCTDNNTPNGKPGRSRGKEKKQRRGKKKKNRQESKCNNSLKERIWTDSGEGIRSGEEKDGKSMKKKKK